MYLINEEGGIGNEMTRAVHDSLLALFCKTNVIEQNCIVLANFVIICNNILTTE